MTSLGITVGIFGDSFNFLGQRAKDLYVCGVRGA
jgi:hypothetical protein